MHYITLMYVTTHIALHDITLHYKSNNFYIVRGLLLVCGLAWRRATRRRVARPAPKQEKQVKPLQPILSLGLCWAQMFGTVSNGGHNESIPFITSIKTAV